MKRNNSKVLKRIVASVTALAMCAGLFLGGVTGSAKEAAEGEGSPSPIRVDINKANDNRPLSWSETFTNWFVGSGTSASTTVGGVTFTLSNGGTTGKGIKGALYKGLLRDGDTTSPRLTADGVLVDFGDETATGGAIKLEISGLSAGTHTLKTWHSFFDKVEGSSMTLSIDGKDVERIASVTRANTDNDATITYNEFEVTEGKKVIVLVRPNGDGAYNNAVLNAFAIDDSDPTSAIKNPVPADGEGHFQPEKGLRWTEADEADSYDVYLGTDYDTVKAATTDSDEFLCTQTATSCAVDTDLSHMETYYWRVDVRVGEKVYKGDVMNFEVAHLAFPTAEGYGRFAKGGRGGRVIEVTNLNDAGPGSLREAIEEEKGARIIVFRVGGVIELQSKLTIPSDGGNVYVAGQTAPGDGITLTKYGFGIYYAEDVIIRHVRVRVGDENGTSSDGMGMAGANNSIIDHCSISWTTDEGTSSRGAKNITFQYNIIAEALHDSVHYNGDNREETETHSFAGSISGNIGSYHHNLLVNCTGRNWSMAGGMEQDGVTYAGKLDIRNNVVYNFMDRTTDGGVKRVNFVNNYYKKGAVSKDMKIFTIDGNELGTKDMQMAYLSGNMLVDKNNQVILAADENAWDEGRASSGGKNSNTSDVRSDVPFFPSYVNTQSATDAYETVVSGAGATVPKQDYLDARYVDETVNGTYTYVGSKKGKKGIIDSQNDVGGYPELVGGRVLKDTDHDGMPNNWEEYHGLNPNDATDKDAMNLSMDGYTNLEMYLNELAGDTVQYAEHTYGVVSDEDPYEAAEDVVPSREPSGGEESAKPVGTETFKPLDADGSKEPAPPTGGEESAAPSGVEESATPSGGEESAKPVGTETFKPLDADGSKEPAPPTGGEESATPSGGEESAKPVGTETFKPLDADGSKEPAPPTGGEESATPSGGEESAAPSGVEESALPSGVEESALPSGGEESTKPVGAETFKPLDADGNKEPAQHPTGKIEIGKNWWETLLEVLTFGLYEAEGETITITSEKETDQIEYYIYEATGAAAALTAEELDTCEFRGYDQGNKPILNDGMKVVVYAKITGLNGLVTYISSDGIVVTKDGGKPGKTWVPGDVTGDGEVQLNDARKALRAALLLEDLDAIQQKAADVDEDGEVKLSDAQQILRKALLLIEEFVKKE